MAGALDGLLVIALEQAVAAPFCSSRLADAGARVIKVERPEGDFARGYDRVARGESAYFVWLNRGKESIALDIKAADDKALLARMIGKADVFLQNLAPGAATRAGLGSAALRERHPKLITCDISGYGEDGPYAAMKAYDLLVQAESGLAAVTGRPEGPGRVGVSVCDIACGLYAHAAVLEALIARGRDGQGRGIAVSLFDALADWMTVPLLHQVYGGRGPERVGLHHPSIAPYGAYCSGDGKETVISIQNEREWTRFCRTVLGDETMAGDPRFQDNVARVANRTELDRRIEEALRDLSRDELTARLSDAAIAFGAVNTTEDLARHPQLRRLAIETPGGPVEMVAAPARMSDGPREAKPVPALDQHGIALRREFGP